MPTRSEALPGTRTLEIAESSSESVSVYRTAALTLALTATGIAGRVALQAYPSIEPVLPLAIVAGFYGGWRHGLVSGATGFYISNFLVMGGQGPWTLFQCLGAGLAGVTAAMLGKASTGRKMLFGALIAGTLVYEVSVNLGSLMFMPSLMALVGAAPYVVIHLGSTLGFGSIAGGFDELIRKGYGN